MKKLSVILLCLVLCLGLSTALAEERHASGDFEYVVLEDGTARITGYGGGDEALDIIPSELDGLPVTSIGEKAFSWCLSLTEATIPEGVTDIGREAFSHCKSLATVAIPGSVTSIGDSAFTGCTNLSSVAISGGVTSIGYGVFSHCGSLTEVVIPDSVTTIGEVAFANCSGDLVITVESGSYAEEYCKENGLAFTY